MDRREGTERMAFEMVDRDQRLAGGEGERLAGDEPDHHPADQARPGGRRDRVDLGEADAGFVQRRFDQRRQHLDMGARRDLRDHAAERAVRGLLPGQLMGENRPVGAHHGGGGLVATGFKAEDQGHEEASTPSSRAKSRDVSRLRSTRTVLQRIEAAELCA